MTAASAESAFLDRLDRLDGFTHYTTRVLRNLSIYLSIYLFIYLSIPNCPPLTPQEVYYLLRVLICCWLLAAGGKSPSAVGDPRERFPQVSGLPDHLITSILYIRKPTRHALLRAISHTASATGRALPWRSRRITSA